MDLAADLLILLGSALCLTTGIALVRFPNALARLHAASKSQVLALLLICVGIALRLQDGRATTQLVLVVGFQLVTIPISAHLIARAAHRSGTARPDVRRAGDPVPPPPES